MNREILFRGKSIETDKWVYGWFTKKKIGNLIVPVIEYYREWDSGDFVETYEVDGETVGQFTGLLDKNKNKIFEGDIIFCDMFFDNATLPHAGEIIYDCEHCSYATKNQAGNTLILNHSVSSMEIKGNVHDNPDLLK